MSEEIKVITAKELMEKEWTPEERLENHGLELQYRKGYYGAAHDIADFLAAGGTVAQLETWIDGPLFTWAYRDSGQDGLLDLEWPPKLEKKGKGHPAR